MYRSVKCLQFVGEYFGLYVATESEWNGRNLIRGVVIGVLTCGRRGIWPERCWLLVGVGSIVGVCR